jgi:hypothetical protein
MSLALYGPEPRFAIAAATLLHPLEFKGPGRKAIRPPKGEYLDESERWTDTWVKMPGGNGSAWPVMARRSSEGSRI